MQNQPISSHYRSPLYATLPSTAVSSWEPAYWFIFCLSVYSATVWTVTVINLTSGYTHNKPPFQSGAWGRGWGDTPLEVWRLIVQLKSQVFLERSRAPNIRSFIAFNLSEGALLPTYCVASCIMCLHCGPRHAPRLFTLGFLNKLVIVVVCNGTGARGQTAAISDFFVHTWHQNVWHIRFGIRAVQTLS
jgi:hypothetical protein